MSGHGGQRREEGVEQGGSPATSLRDLGRDDSDDPLGAARGFVVGFLLVLPAWALAFGWLLR